ncbi:MAG: MBL fold metallo-hydrolase RNA specificity domain-containing protein [Bacteroidia bacterium]
MINLQFFGAAQMVTGSKHLITTPKGKKILLDCGLVQGKPNANIQYNRHFGFDPITIEYVILSHAHIDHCGLLPRLVREGFRGIIFAHPATISLCELMLFDSAHIQKDDLGYLNERRKKRGEQILEPLYDLDDVKKTLTLFEPVEYDEELKIDDEITFHFTDAGHLLGSCAVHLDIKIGIRKKTKITFTGDIGRYNDPILRNPEEFRQCDYLICESTYGDRLHPKEHNAEQKLLEIVKHTCVEKMGKLIIPAFSVDRTQEIIYFLEKASNSGILPNIKVFVDSPLSVNATRVIEKHQECYREDFVLYMQHHDPEPFCFKNLSYISDVEESKKLNDLKEPCIIISASGMAEAGRVKHHIKNNIGDIKNTVLLVGYCTPESLGGRLKAGNKTVRIFGEEFPVKAEVISLEYYSAHADYEEIMTYLKCQKKSKIKEVFLVHGEPEAQHTFKGFLIAKGFEKVSIPAIGDKYDLV